MTIPIITNKNKEIDYVEEHNGVFTAYEMKWNVKRKGSVSLPKAFALGYDVKEIKVVTPENYLDILCRRWQMLNFAD